MIPAIAIVVFFLYMAYSIYAGLLTVKIQTDCAIDIIDFSIKLKARITDAVDRSNIGVYYKEKEINEKYDELKIRDNILIESNVSIYRMIARAKDTEKRVHAAIIEAENKLEDYERSLLTLFTNKYYCEDCDERWEDVWSSMCDDKCPKCNKAITPYESEEILNN